MDKNIVVHVKNKYPQAQVRADDQGLDAYSQDGEHILAIRKNGANQFVDQSAELGCRDRFDLSPLPKESRVFKVVDGKIGFAEEADARKESRKRYMKGDKVLSCEELKKEGWDFDERQREIKAPKAQE